MVCVGKEAGLCSADWVFRGDEVVVVFVVKLDVERGHNSAEHFGPKYRKKK